MHVPIAVCSIVVALTLSIQDETKCPSCGKENGPKAKSCGKCGQKLGETAPEEKREPKGLAGVGLTAEEVNRAIDRGADYLIAAFQAGKYHADEVFLIGLALSHANALDRNAKVRTSILTAVREAEINSLGTYRVAILAMLLDALGIEQRKLADCAKYFVETQGDGGAWGYGKSVPQLKGKKATRSLVSISGGIPIDEPGKPWVELKRENPPRFGEDGDNSCTQYAILGLRAAARRGIGIPKEIWEKCYEVTAKRFDDRGKGWGYHGGSAYGAMTCAAGTTAAICAYHLGKDISQDSWVRSGRAWMAGHFAVNRHPPKQGSWLGYYLYSLERFARIVDVEFLGAHEWYPLGARFLVDSQKSDGAWDLKDHSRIASSTSFALLFLTRATPTLVEELKRGGAGTLETEALLPGEYYHIILDASGSMLAKMQDRVKIDIARESISTLLQQLEGNAWVGLRVYGHTKRAIHEGADTDSLLEIPISPLKREAYLTKLNALRCMGKTPLTYSLKCTVQDLRAIPQGMESTVILLTDGMESTRGAVPWKAAEELAQAHPKAHLYVIGFDVQDPTARKQLEAIAAAGQGVYVPAPDAESLANGLVRVVHGVDTYVVLDGQGQEVVRGRFGDRQTLKEGKYEIVFPYREKEIRRTFWVNTERKTRVVVDVRSQD